MAYIWSSHERMVVDDARELRHAPRTLVRFGVAPDGLPWLVDVDRAQRLDLLFRTVLQVFELGERSELPERVRTALENDVAAGLMGVHEVVAADWPGGPRDDNGPIPVYASRRKIKHLLGPTLLSQILEGVPLPRKNHVPDASVNTNVSSMAAREGDLELVEAVERSIRERQAKRHLLIELSSGRAFTGSVRNEDRALRVPSPPYRPLVAESLSSLAGAVARIVSSQGQIWRVPVANTDEYLAVLMRAQQNPGGGTAQFEVSRNELLRALAAVARNVQAIHERGRVHADIAPGNILLAGQGPVSFDSLEVEAGTPATAATFAWAAPEQIIGHPVDARTDVYSLGKIATGIIEGVPFGEETTYIVPIGGDRSRRVQLLKAEGVFIDILDTDYSRSWQLAWQDFLGRSIAYDRPRRPEHAAAFADLLDELVESHPVSGMLDCPGEFGNPLLIQQSGSWSFARLVAD